MIEEKLEIREPEIDKELAQKEGQQMLDIDTAISQQEPQEIPKERYAGLSAWGARTLLKATKPLVKTARKKMRLIVKPLEQVPPVKTKQLPGMENVDDMVKQANDISNAELKQFKTTDSHQVNFDTIEGGDDVTATIAQMADANKLEIDEARRGVITDDMLTGLANDLGQDPEFVTAFMNRQHGTAVNAETVLATRQMLEQSAGRLKEAAQKISTHAATDLEKLDFSKQWQFHRQFMNQFMGMRAEFGRGLRAFGVPMEGMEQAKINEVMGMVAHDMSIDRLAEQIMTVDTTKGINGLVQAQDNMARKGTKVFVENFIASILSGVKTQIVNTSGNGLRLGMDIPDTMVASVIGKLMPDQQEKILADEALAKVFGLVNGFQDALQTGWKVAKTAEPYGGIDKLDMLHQKAISSEYLGMQADSIAGKMVDTYGTVVRAPLERVMGGVDGFFKVLGERSTLAGVAYRKAAQSGLSGDDASRYLADLMENPTDDMIRQMEDFALDVTFQKPLGETGQAIQRVVSKSPALKMFMPFIKTPTNLMKQAFLERTPLGLFARQYKDEIAAGGARAQIARAKMVNGTMLGMNALLMATSGKITGSNPTDNKARVLRYETGWRPRSFVFENEDGTKDYISYDRLEPFSYIFGTVADMVEYQNMIMYDDPDEDAEKAFSDAVGGLIAGFTKNTLDKTFMTGVKSIMSVWLDHERYGKTYYKNMVNAIAPLSGIRRDLAKLSDDTIKESFGAMEKLRASTPGFNKDLPNRLDNYGEPIVFDTVLSPWATSVSTKDKVKLEMQRLAETTRSVAITRPSKRIEGIKLTSQQYHDFVQYARKDMEVNGMNFKDTMQDIIESDMYQEAPTDDARVLMLNTVKRSFDEAAKAWMRQSDEALSEKIQQKKEHKLIKLLGKE